MNSRYLVAGIVIVGLIAGGVYFFKMKQKPLAAVKVEAEDINSKGPVNAPVTMIEYSDFQCPACMQSQAIIGMIMTRYAGQVRLIYRHFPLPAHRWAGMAHQAAECAGEQGQFWPYHDRLYREQLAWSGTASPLEIFLRYANDNGLNLEAFGRCMADENVRARILSDKKKGEALKLQSTPTFFINGERVVGGTELLLRGEPMIRKILGLPENPPAGASPSIPAIPVKSEKTAAA